MNLLFETDFSTGQRVLYTKQLVLSMIGFEKDEVLGWMDSSIIRALKKFVFNNEFNIFEL